MVPSTAPSRKLINKMQKLQLIVPSVLRKEVIRDAHDSVIAVHMGVKRTYNRIDQSFYWFEMKADIALYIKG
ncbi:hypothetical protein DPMN_089809 [Dreissena polymorpha]|uniref:Integrase zinc-binding domain-containing protein n=1 Tax=Dreissena polymorpha TaxID=45954 RepID=A0A9D4KXI7_DREPO|nr:hypothetical protein DPMN_089809 [Dreissena polymorpha]